MALRVRDEVHRKQLEDMAETWTMLARERRKQLAKQGAAILSLICVNGTDGHCSLYVAAQKKAPARAEPGLGAAGRPEG